EREHRIASDLGICRHSAERCTDGKIVSHRGHAAYALHSDLGAVLLVSTHCVAAERRYAVRHLHGDIGLQDVRCPFELRFHVPLDVAVCSHDVTSRALQSLTDAILSRVIECENTRNYIAASARE